MMNRREFCSVLGAAPFSLSFAGEARGEGGFAAKSYQNTRGQRMPYQLFIPKEYDSGRRYPLVLWLHGGAGRGNDNLKQISGGNAIGSHVWTLPENQTGNPCFVVAPQCPDRQEWATVAVYVCYLQTAKLPDILPHFPIMHYVVRAKGDAAALAGSVRRELQAIDPNQVIFYVRPLTGFISDAVAQRRFNMLLITLFAALALILAAAGIYGVLTYTVAQRTRELGIRFALGATGADALRLIISQGMRLVTLGVGAGLLASLALTQLLKSLLYGVKAIDPLTFAMAPLLLILVSLIACYLPARRATKVDPLVALRSE